MKDNVIRKRFTASDLLKLLVVDDKAANCDIEIQYFTNQKFGDNKLNSLAIIEIYSHELHKTFEYDLDCVKAGELTKTTPETHYYSVELQITRDLSPCTILTIIAYKR
jgi:hypothetical protein